MIIGGAQVSVKNHEKQVNFCMGHPEILMCLWKDDTPLS
jgi:hypothetical protein